MRAPASNALSTSLFRQEAYDAHRPQQYGSIVLLPGASSRWLALAALALIAALVALIVLGSYTRRSTVAGQLQPSEGLIRIAAGQSGVIIERHAVDGQTVRTGEVLFVLSGDRLGPDALDYQRGISAQIEARRLSLESELRRIAQAEEQETDQLRRRSASLRGEAEQVERQGQLLSARVKGAEDAFARYEDLQRRGYASRDELLARESELTEARARVEGQRRDRLALGRELGATQRDAEAMRSRYATQRAELQRAIMQARQEFTEIEARRRIVVTAPAAGRLTLVQGEIGQAVDPAHPLTQLVPSSSQLVARLFVPSRAAGFLKPGSNVLLRYDSFPHQKFGQHAGRVLSVSTAAVAPVELQGLSLRPEMAGEMLFAITVGLPAQSMGDGSTALPLQAGMRVEADLLHETRRLYEWILEPLYAARARLNSG